MASEGGRHEVEMAKMRLATARTQASAASKNMQRANDMVGDADAMIKSAQAMKARATKNRDAAQLQLQSTRSEVGSAEKCLAETEKRWEVIDVDQEPADSTTNEGRSKKRRKITLSPPPPNDEVLPRLSVANLL